MMNAYNIKLNGKWFIDVGEVNGQTSSGGWYDTGQSTREILLTENQNEAKLIEGMTNLNSYFKKIYESVRYSDTKMEIKELLIVKVGEC